jgi:uncharacterized membrane protein
MLKQSDTEGRLRLFRYGLVVIVVVAFLISLLIGLVARQALLNNLTPELADQVPGIDVFFTIVAVTTIVTAIVAVLVYFGYSYILTRKLPFGLLDNSQKKE